jgi:cephalosporin-C deacetylase-like acetyl esterase
MGIADVQGYWRSVDARAAQYATSCEIKSVTLDLGNPRARYADLELSSLDGSPIEARLIVPQTEGSHPVVVVFHDATRPIRGWQHLTRFVALDYAVLALKNRPGVEGVLVDEPLAVGDGLGVAVRIGTEKAPRLSRVVDEKTQQTLMGVYADALVLAHAAHRIEGLDVSRIVCWGEGLGGGVALAAASLVGAAGAAALNPLPAALDASAEQVDVAVIAKGYDNPVLLGTCLLDLQATPEAQDLLASGLGQVERLRYPRYAHERVNAFEDQLLTWLVARRDGRDSEPMMCHKTDV